MAYTGSKAQAGRGSKIAIGPVAGTSSPTYVEIMEIRNATLIEAIFDTEDVSNFDSNLDKEFVKLMRDNGKPKFSGNRVSSDAGQLAAIAAFNDAASSYMMQVTLPKRPDQVTTADVYTFNALVIGFTIGPVEVNKAIPVDITLQITGPATFTAGA